MSGFGVAVDKDEYQTDTELAQLTRAKYAPVGWHYQAHCMEIITSKIGGIHCKNKDGTDVGFASLKFYDANNVEIVSGLQADLDLLCVHTRIVWTPTYSIEIISGSIKPLAETTEDIRLWATAASHIPEGYGGTKRFIQGGLNFKFIKAKTELKTDGRSSKHIALDTVNNSHVWNFDVKHPAGLQYEFQLIVEFYKA